MLIYLCIPVCAPGVLLSHSPPYSLGKEHLAEPRLSWQSESPRNPPVPTSHHAGLQANLAQLFTWTLVFEFPG